MAVDRPAAGAGATAHGSGLDLRSDGAHRAASRSGSVGRAGPARRTGVSRVGARPGTAQSGRWSGRGAGAVGGHQPGPVDELAEQRLGVDVALAVAQPEVQLAARRGRSTAPAATASPGRQRRRRQPAVRRPQPVDVGDDDVAGAGDDAAERDRAGRRGPDERCPAAAR